MTEFEERLSALEERLSKLETQRITRLEYAVLQIAQVIKPLRDFGGEVLYLHSRIFGGKS